LENKKEFSRGKKRTTLPGQHGSKKKRFSTYSIQNKEKQKIRFLYGLREKQLRNLLSKLKSRKGNIKENLIITLESRFDNIVFRSGLVTTRRMARQLVNHGHFLVDGKKVDIPSYEIKLKSIIQLKKNSLKENPIIKEGLEKTILTAPYVSLNKDNLDIKYLRYPNLSEANKGINIDSILEWYNKRI
jgi:small subunit ribosomal protein S4